MSNLHRDMEYELNRLAGTVVNGVPSLAAQAAANVWLGGGATYDLLGALNRKAGKTDQKTFLGLRAICNQLGSTTDLDPASALRAIP